MSANKSFLSDLLQTISDRGRDLLSRTRGRTKPSGEVRTENLVELCEHLLSGRGEASGVALAAEILDAYRELKTGERVAFFEALVHRFGPDRERLKQASRGLLASLRELLRPMHHWTQNTTTQAEVKVFILDSLWRSLPRPPFTDEETEAVADRVYDFVWQQSASGHNLSAA